MKWTESTSDATYKGKVFVNVKELDTKYYKMWIRDRYMAQLGFKTVDEMVGRSDLLEPKDDVKNLYLIHI